MLSTILTPLLLLAIWIPVGGIFTKIYYARFSVRLLVLSLAYFVFAVNATLALAFPSFYLVHVFIDSVLISIVVPVIATENKNKTAENFLFHFAILYLGIFAVIAIALIAPPVNLNNLGIGPLLLAYIFAVSILIQNKPKFYVYIIIIGTLWFASTLTSLFAHNVYTKIFASLFLFILSIKIEWQLLLVSRQMHYDNSLLKKSRDAVLSMLNDLSSSEEYMASVENTFHRVLHTITETLGVESVAFYKVQKSKTDDTKVLQFSRAVGRFYPLQPVDEFIIKSKQLVSDFLKGTHFKIGEGVVGTVAETRQPLLLNIPLDHHKMAYFGINTRVTRNILAIPFNVDNELDGVIVVQNCLNSPALTTGDTSLLQFLGDQAGISVKNANMYIQLTTTARLRQEANIATKIQNQLLPKSIPAPENLRIANYIKPAKEVGGDYYDFIQHNEHNVDIVIGDVSGKGVPAGMIMAIAKVILQIIAHHSKSVLEIVAQFSKEIYVNMDSGQFMTLNYLRWQGAQRMLSFAGAGHEHVLWFHGNSGRAEKIRAGGLAVGLVEDCVQYIKQNDLQLEAGDVVVLYTDGVTEARNPNGDLFTLGRLLTALESYAYLRNPDKIRDLLIKDVHDFMNGAEQFDDITMLVLTVVS